MQVDFLVFGSGLGGLTFALKTAPHGKVVVVSKGKKIDSTTSRAQGGLAAVIHPNDSFAKHIEDTLAAGGGLCDRPVVEKIIRHGPALVEELLKIGVNFSQAQNRPALTQEGGHSHPRILHAQDATGLEIQRALLAVCERHPNIQFLEDHMAVDLITNRHLTRQTTPNQCYGAYVLAIPSGEIKTIEAKVTLLATGGAGKVYLYTSNPDSATGDGIALAWRAGVPVANMEFVQFHPTCLYSPQAKTFLISEAVRGEGGILTTKDGNPFMKKYDSRGELATRDIVARAIDFELKKRGDPFILLDISHRPASFIKERFPTIHQTCLNVGIDMTKEPIPVVPAAHYFCGGVQTDSEGKTPLPRLLAAGEVAHTGLHGACRLASNSLLEAAALAHFAAQTAISQVKAIGNQPPMPPWDPLDTIDSDEEVVIAQNWEEIRTFMWNYVGIVRSNKRLQRAQNRIKLLLKEINEYYWNFKINKNLLELRNVAIAADLIIASALTRKESRGLHYNIDYPTPNPDYTQATVINKP